MQKSIHMFIGFVIISILVLTACNQPNVINTATKPANTTSPTQKLSTQTTRPPTSTPTQKVTRVLSICIGQEPNSLFLYGDTTRAAQNIRQAIYDGPFDIQQSNVAPVILENIPSRENGGVLLVPTPVTPGELIINNDGQPVNLGEGVRYRPSGCLKPECARTYTGNDPINIDTLTVRFRFLPNVMWSDGIPLTADDSVYAYELAKSLYPAYRSELIAITRSYSALDAVTIEWKGIPGYQAGPYYIFLFSPLPRHAWGMISPGDLITIDLSTRAPLGWGPYVIDQWVPGDHISLYKNPIYFRASTGLPKFDQLVFRFMKDSQEALDALQAGECDLADDTALQGYDRQRLSDLQNSGVLSTTLQIGTGWEQILFGIENYTPTGQVKHPSFFSTKEVRQAVALCIDRENIVNMLGLGTDSILDTYVLPVDPLYNPKNRHYDYDPQKAGELLTRVGWVDADNDPHTARISQGVDGVPDGTPSEFTFLTTNEVDQGQTASLIQESLAQCGIKVKVEKLTWENLLAGGPDGPVFGRHFDMAQFGWTFANEPTCAFYRSDEIPGPYPEFPKGWGGANASGYRNPDFDRVCTLAMTVLPDSPEYREAHLQAQAIFAEDLPALPLYAHYTVMATRPDLCGLVSTGALSNPLWNIEAYDYGEGCISK